MKEQIKFYVESERGHDEFDVDKKEVKKEVETQLLNNKWVTLEHNDGSSELITKKDIPMENLDKLEEDEDPKEYDEAETEAEDVKKIQWRTFLKKYKPVKNTLNDAPFSGYMFETYGDEYEALKKLADASAVNGLNGYHVWTIVDGTSNGKCYLLNGWHVVNRLGYVFSETPWVEGDEIISTGG